MGCLFSSAPLCLRVDDFSSTSLSSPSSSLFVYDDDSLPFDLLPPIYIPVRPSDFFSSVCFFFLLLLFPLRGASAPCPAVEGCRLGPSSVSDKVGLQPAACPTRGPSPPGLVTPSSAPLLPQCQRRAQAGLSQLEDQH